MKGITKIGKREAFRRLKGLGIYKRIPRKKLRQYPRHYIVDRGYFNIEFA